MKHNKIKQYIKLGILLFGFSIFLWNCVDERDFLAQEISEHQHQEHQIRLIKENEIPQSVIDFIDQASSGSKQVKFDKATGGILFSKRFNQSSDDFGTIDESRAVIVSYHGEARYTFLVLPDHEVDNEVVNLIVVENEQGIQEYFIKYQFNHPLRSRDLSTRSPNEMTSFSGTITYYDKDGNQIGETTMSNGSTTNTIGEGIPCPPDDEPNSNADDTTNTNGGGGSGDETDHTEGGNDGSGGGEFVDPDNCSVISYSACFLPDGSRGGADGHRPVCQDPGSPHGVNDPECQNRCTGSATTITDWCTGSSVTFRTANDDLVAVECENTVGIIFEKEDCEELNQQVTDSAFLEKMHELEDKLNDSHESGYAQEYTGEYNPMELADNGNQLKFPTSSTVKGIMHNHAGPIKDIDPDTGVENEFWLVNMYSPKDIESFLQIASNGDGTYFDVSETYSALVTFEGNYILKFRGDINNIPSTPDATNNGVRKDYDRYVMNRENKIFGLLQFLRSYNVYNIIIYEINDLGAQTGHYMDEEWNYKIVECF